MTNDDTMRRIEEALEVLIDRAAVSRGVPEQRAVVRALIRAALPQPDAPPDKPRSLLEGHGIGAGIDHRDPGGWGEDDDKFRANAEHEAAVEAWRKDATSFPDHDEHDFFHVQRCVIDEALRLMRARPQHKEATDGD